MHVTLEPSFVYFFSLVHFSAVLIMADEKSISLVDTEQPTMTDSLPKQEELFMPSEPPAYETLQLIDTNVTPPYPGLDAELPNYCEIVTDVVHNQPRRHTQVTYERRGAGYYLPYIILIGCAVIAVVLFFPIGVCGLGYSIAALQHKRLYKERSTHMRTAIGCILLAVAMGVPIHIVFWRHIL